MLTLRNLTRTLDFARIDELMHFALDGKLHGDVVVMVIEQDRTLDRLSNDDYELQALLYKSGLAHVYSLIIRSRTSARDLESIIFHESVHLLQYESGKLDVDPITGWAKWNGEHYDAKTPYRARPWEKEAFRGQDMLQKAWRQAKRKK
jgi:hypothetical protein